ncbi:MAG: hypothetical protein N2260_06690 [Syntrophobacterales bacterium]|nr:hypothetical protein [Syntrophobacterales bacterium]
MSLTAKIYRSMEDLDPKVRDVLLLVIEEIEKEQKERVTKDEFRELKAIISELSSNVVILTQAQAKAEERLSRVEKAIEELTQAQAKAEERLSKAEKTIEELILAQKKTEERLEELARAQKRTEEKLEDLIKEHKKTREHLGGITHTIGYRLEDEAIWALPALLKRDFGIHVRGQLRRDFIEISPNRYIEVNIWGEGVRNETPIAIFGEAKTQLRKDFVNNFLARVEKIKKFINPNVFPVLITYHTSPQVKKFLQEAGIALYVSYELRS